MLKQKITILILMSLFAISCAKETKKTTAKLKLNLAGITNLGSGIGTGGAILFGKSAAGEQFGKIVSANEQDMDLPNGDWSFYAVMWANTTSYNIKDTAYCGKSIQNLNGTAATVSMTLSNAGCADADFSAGKHYVDGLSKIHFANFYMEECDDLGQSNNISCLRDNQGSALSYRMVFKSYKKMPGAAVPAFSNEVLFSKCITAGGGTTLFNTGMEINFPSSKSAMPFVVSTEMFLGSTDCGVSVPEVKGVFTHTFQQGLMGESTLLNKNVPSPGLMCSTGPATKEACENYFGSWSGSTCSLTENMVAAFLPAAECAGSTSQASVKYIKQMVSIPKDFLCRNTSYGLTGGDVFPGGDGSIKRPYKICSEWQLNQIGEPHTSSSGFSASSFKLMNDLDMNNADFNVAARPYCVGVAGSIYKRHHNLNPIGQSSNGACTSASSVTPYTGIFNGNFKTISHARINVGIDYTGFVRKIGTNGVVKNLSFKNLEVEGNSNVGGVTSGMYGTNGLISNVKIFGGNIDSNGVSTAGVAAVVSNTNKISDVQVRNLSIHSGGKAGGLVAVNNGAIDRSMFRGRINQHNSSDTHIGGLVAEAGTGSAITASFSEGEIDSAAKWTGGIAGINAGSILNSYTSMLVLSRYGMSGDSSAFVGGIVAGNETGTIASVFFDGVLLYKGQTSSTLDGIAAFPSSGTLATCAASILSLPQSNSFCSSGVNLRSGAVTEFTGNSAWKFNVVGSLPRLSWEFDKSLRSCLLADNLVSVSAQVTAGRGTYLLPVIICNATQLKDLAGTPVNRYVKLGDDINISSWILTDIIPTFSGVLDGQDHSIFGANISNVAAGNTGLFVNNTGTLSNLKIVGNTVNQNNGGSTGILAGVSSGIIRNIFMMGNAISADSYVGHLVGSNSVGGIVADIFIKEGNLIGGTYVGGITGNNQGTISHTSVNLGISDGTNAYMKFGGIAGFNGTTGTVMQSVFSGNMNFAYVITNATPTYIGGLVGYNSGSIENSMTKNYTVINVKNANSVGGLVGFNAAGAFLKKSISLGKLIYTSGAVPAASTFSPQAGVNSGAMSDTLYLENTSAGFIGQAISTVCSQTDIDFTTAAPSYLTFVSPQADLIESVNYPFGGDALRNYIPFTVPSTNFNIAYNNNSTCTNGDSFRFYKGYDMEATGKSIMDLSMAATFSAFDLAYESSSGSGLNVDRLISYYKSEMYGTPPVLTPPIWEMDENDDYPRLLQVRD